MESRFQHLQAELQDMMQRTIECAKPTSEAVSVEVQVPSPEARAIWATDAGVQVSCSFLPSKHCVAIFFDICGCSES